MELSLYFKSIIEEDKCSIVICDLTHKIIYLNPAAKKNYAKYGNLISKSILDCHNEKSRELILKVVNWFSLDKKNNRVHTYFNEKQNKDVYMIALRDDENNLIGYYEKHEFRTRDESPFYDI